MVSSSYFDHSNGGKRKKKREKQGGKCSKKSILGYKVG